MGAYSRVGANSRLGAYSSKYGNSRRVSPTGPFHLIGGFLPLVNG